MHKKILSVLLSLVLMAAAVPAAYAASFPDVDASAAWAAAVEHISEYGIMVGDAKGNFNPGQTVSRAEMAAIICRMLGKTEGLQGSAVFSDVPANHWANAYIAKAAELGIVGGYGNGKFGPSDPVTYEQAVTMVIRAKGEDSVAAGLGGYPAGYLQAAEDGSLLEGVPGAQGQGMTRGAIAILLNNHYMWCPEKPGDGHDHDYVEKTMPGSGAGAGGHYEEKQVQAGTETVNDYAQVTIYGCNKCSFTTYDANEMLKHNDARYAKGPCVGANYWSKTTTEVVGTHEEPVYETRTTWVADPASAITVRLCALCGQMEPSAPANGHTHQYVEKPVVAAGNGVYYVEVETQISTKTVNDYETKTMYGCGACSLTSYDWDVILRHTDARYEEAKPVNGGHGGARTWSETKKVVVGTHEEPVYGTRTIWVNDPTAIIRVCEICGQTE